MDRCDIVHLACKVGRLKDCEVEHRNQSSVDEGGDEEVCRHTERISDEAGNDLTEKDIMLVAGMIAGRCDLPKLRPRIQHEVPHSDRSASLVNEEYVADSCSKKCKQGCRKKATSRSSNGQHGEC